MNANIIKIAKLKPNAVLPSRKHPLDAGMDFYACEGIVILPHEGGIVHTGITIEIPPGWVGLMKPKSKSDFLIGAGVIDAGYQGEIMIKVINPLNDELVIGLGDAVGQMVLLPVLTPEVIEVDIHVIHGVESPRGESGGIVSQDRAIIKNGIDTPGN
jgi:dUTP pyrophosphatase